MDQPLGSTPPLFTSVLGRDPLATSALARVSSPILFVGERRSPRAMAMGVDWTHGRLSAKTLHEALRASGLYPSEQLFVNLFRDPPSPLEVDPEALEELTKHRLSGGPVIALGKRVSAYLERVGIPHVALVHPAARGSIRRTETTRRMRLDSRKMSPGHGRLPHE